MFRILFIKLKLGALFPVAIIGRKKGFPNGAYVLNVDVASVPLSSLETQNLNRAL